MKNNYGKLLGRIIEMYGTRAAFCDAVGMSPSTLTERLKGKSGFRQVEIKRIASPEFLNIPLNEIGEYFFCSSSSQNENSGTQTSTQA